MCVKIQLFKFGVHRSKFCVLGCMKNMVCKEKVNTREELVTCIMNSAALIKQRGLKSALNSMGILNIFFEQLQFYCDHLPKQINAINMSVVFLHTFCKALMRIIQTAVSPHPRKLDPSLYELIYTE